MLVFKLFVLINIYLLQLVSDSGNTLKAKHQTPVKKYTDDLTFTFNNASPNCNVQVIITEFNNTVESCYLHRRLKNVELSKIRLKGRSGIK